MRRKRWRSVSSVSTLGCTATPVLLGGRRDEAERRRAGEHHDVRCPFRQDATDGARHVPAVTVSRGALANAPT